MTEDPDFDTLLAEAEASAAARELRTAIADAQADLVQERERLALARTHGSAALADERRSVAVRTAQDRLASQVAAWATLRMAFPHLFPPPPAEQSPPDQAPQPAR